MQGSQNDTVEMTVDITSFNFHQLDAQRTRVEHRVTEMRETGAPALREQWSEQAAAIGMTIEEILQAGKKRGRGNGGGKHQQEAGGRRLAREGKRGARKRASRIWLCRGMGSRCRPATAIGLHAPKLG
jgi:hypothetical protein